MSEMLDLVGLSAGWVGLAGAVLFAVVAVLRGGFKSLLLLAALVALLPVLNIGSAYNWRQCWA